MGFSKGSFNHSNRSIFTKAASRGKLVLKAESFGLGDESVFIASSEAEWKIAVVDDDPIINRMAEHQLKSLSLKAEVLTFNDGQDFKEYLEKEYISQTKDQNLLILLDINMLHFNGWDVLSFISKESLDSKVQVAESGGRIHYLSLL